MIMIVEEIMIFNQNMRKGNVFITWWPKRVQFPCLLPLLQTYHGNWILCYNLISKPFSWYTTCLSLEGFLVQSLPLHGHICKYANTVVTGPRAIFTWVVQPVPAVEVGSVRFCSPLTPGAWSCDSALTKRTQGEICWGVSGECFPS